MPNFDEDSMSDNVVNRSDAISDPTDLSWMWQGTRSFSPQTAAINIGHWYNRAIGNGPPDKMPEGSLAADAGYNSIGKGYEGGGEVTGGLSPNADTNTTDETPSSMQDVTGSIGATGTQGPSQSGIEWFPPASEKDKSSNPDMTSYLFHKATQPGTPSTPEEDAQANQSPLAPTNIKHAIGNAVGSIPGYGGMARKLASELITYAKQKYQGDPAGELHGQPMDAGTHQVIKETVDGDNSLPNASKKALQYAFDRGAEPGLSFLQTSIAKYDSSRAWAAAAYDGKNIQASIDGMNRAIRELPLDEHIQLALGDNGGVTATVVKSDGSDPVHFYLTGSQYREFSRGGSGFAHDLINNPLAVLAKLVNTNHDLWAPPTSEGVAPDPKIGVVPESWKARGVNQAMWNTSGQMFQSVGAQPQRFQFLEGLLAQKEKYTNELNVAKQQGINRAQVAAITGASRQGVAETQAGSRERVAQENVAGRKEVEGMRGETQREVASTRAKSYDERSVLQAQSRLQDAQVRQQIAAQRIPVGLAGNILGNVGKGLMTEDQADAILKKGGTSLSQLMELLKPQQAPTSAPQVQGGQGAAQVAQSKGGTWTFPGGKPDPKKPNGGAVWTPNQ